MNSIKTVEGPGVALAGKIFLLLGIGLGNLLVGCEQPFDGQTPRGTLVWQDEFNGSAVDESLWKFETGNGTDGWGNNERQYYLKANSSVVDIPGESGKALVITAKKESSNGYAYTSSRLKTQGLSSWTYGRIEARLKLPEGQGIWPAFWMLGDSISTEGWARCGEIDIMEMIGGTGGNDQTAYGTLHWWNGSNVHSGGSKTLSEKLSAGFHVYAVDWTKSEISWMIDGVVFFKKSITDSAYSAFHKPQFLLLNLAVGGNWPGDPDSSTVFPQKFWIDWIRVYQKQ